jgi:hypothetical protein
MLKSGLNSLRSRSNNTVLGVVALIAVIIQVVRFVQLGPQLAAVSASTAGSPSVSAPRDSILTFGAGDINEYRLLMLRTEQIVQTFKAVPTTRPVEAVALKINPFQEIRAVDPPADQATQERTETVTAAQLLTLRSVMRSQLAPVCLINNVLLREKQQLNGFTVDKINSNAVFIHRGIYRFELRLLK